MYDDVTSLYDDVRVAEAQTKVMPGTLHPLQILKSTHSRLSLQSIA